jgi:outer membrane protein
MKKYDAKFITDRISYNVRLAYVLIFTLLTAPLSYGSDLLEVYHQALENDPTFKAAYSTFMSKTESVSQAIAALLPQLTFGAQGSRNLLGIDAGGPIGIDTQEEYFSHQWTIRASQAIFNYQSWAKVQQAKASVKAAHATFNSASQDLILRVAKAYLIVLFSRDTLSFAEAKKRANKRQLEQAQQRFNVGLDAITSVYEAKAAYDRSISEVISAKNNQINVNENLRKLTNHVYDFLSPLRNGTIPLLKPEPDNVDEWIAAGLRQNYDLFSAKFNLQVARENVKIQAGGSWPTLDLQGNTTQTTNITKQSNFFIPDKQNLSNVVLAMNFPIFQGGLVHANTKQAKFDFQTASEGLEKVYRDVAVNSSIAFNTIVDGISKVKADRQTIKSQRSSLESTDAQFQVGTRTMVDVVNAQQKLFEAQEQLASDQYGLINAMLNLKYLAGSLNVNDLAEVNSWLDTTRINGLPPTQIKNDLHH